MKKLILIITIIFNMMPFNNISKINSLTKNCNLIEPIYINSNKDNSKLALYEFFDKNNDKEIIIFLPGAGFYANSLYQTMALNFFNNNRNIVLFDLRGHGKSAGKRGDCPSYSHIMSDIESVIIYYKEKFHNYKIILAGHSSGAGTIINYAQTNFIQPDECLFIAPYLGSQNKRLFKKNNFIKQVKWWIYIINNIINLNYFKHIETIFFNYDDIKKDNHYVVDSYSYEMSIATTPKHENDINNIKIKTNIFLAKNDELFNNDEILKIINVKNNFFKINIIDNSTHLDILLSKQLYNK